MSRLLGRQAGGNNITLDCTPLSYIHTFTHSHIHTCSSTQEPALRAVAMSAAALGPWPCPMEMTEILDP